ncbi:hypothetical protein LTR09_010584 [Extremus antarcticus]|uniref:N-acetyltransferase domain-containing protein n=1 Tax=Extremus antarcticus TaxID=702011 RepID=A0AAJ0GB32_9PEZI|nr:hypothetical protein LTR09_010584 [Extremus antarcticus]
MATPKDPFRSTNLIYTAPESPLHDPLFHAIQTNPTDFANSNARLLHPQSAKDASTYLKSVTEDCLLGVIINRPPKTPEEPPTPIGTIHLSKLSPTMTQHRFSEIGIDIVHSYQGQGYGSEAIRWCLDWAFDVAGLHRVAVRAFEWNEGARRLYERIGFVREGVAREELWMGGRWWDGYCYGMLEGEWRALREGSGEGGSSISGTSDVPIVR